MQSRPIRAWIFSDTHYEVLYGNFTPDPPDGEIDLIIIPGDFDNIGKAIGRIRGCSAFRGIPVIYVPGNHEHYNTGRPIGAAMREARVQLKALARQDEAPIHILDNDTVEMVAAGQKLRIIGATLWTNYKLLGDQARHIEIARRGLNDYRAIAMERIIEEKAGKSWGRTPMPFIYYAQELLTPEATIGYFNTASGYIRRQLRKPFNGKTIVVTHHGPSMQSIVERYKDNPISAAYASNCESIMKLGVDLWAHGHVHDSLDYTIGSTRVVANPRGRTKEGMPENKTFDPKFVAEIL